MRGYAKSFSRAPSGLIMYKTNRVVVPDGEERTSLLSHFHDRLDKGHFGYKKTLDSISEHFYWDTIAADTRAFVTSCNTCERNKPSDFRTQGLLHPLPVPDDRFASISMDFGTLTLSDDGFDQFAVLQDRLTKLIEIIPISSNVTALEFANLIYRNWYLRGYGFPTSTVSDRDPRFLSAVWKEFCTIIGVDQIVSVSRHQRTNGGAESIIKMFKYAVRRNTHYNGRNWTAIRPALQFAYNNSIHSTTGFRPFYLAFGITPLTFPLFVTAQSPALATSFTKHRNALVKAHDAIHHTNRQSAAQYDKHHRHPSTYTAGNFVWLSRDGLNYGSESNISTPLLSPFLGPYKIRSVDHTLGNVTLELPPTMRIHNTFHVSSLKPWRDPTSQFPTRSVPSEPAPSLIDGNEEYEVAAILDFKTTHRGKKFKFLVRWRGFGREHDTWEPASSLTHCMDTFNHFLATHPTCSFRFPASVTSARGGVRS
jgi:transposase InsO family protein